MTIRPLLLRLHRYAGLYLMLFLVTAGITGGLLAFRYEINRWLNPEYRVAPQAGPMLDPFQLRDQALALAPGARINSMPLYVDPGDAFVVSPELPAGVSGAAPNLGFSAIILNPYTGEEIHRVRETKLWPVSRHNFLAFVGALHNRLALGPLGRWLIGLTALAFFLDCFVALYLALTPPALPLRKGFAFRLHRSAGLLLWPILMMTALSSVAMSLPSDVYLPVMKTLFPGETFFDRFPRLPEPRPEPGLNWREARAIGRNLMEQQAKARGFTIVHEGRLAYFPEEGQFVYTVRTDREIIRRGVFTAVYFDGVTGTQTLATSPIGDGPGSHFTLWLMAFHTGDTLLVPALFLFMAVAASLALVILPTSGVLLWRGGEAQWRHKNKKHLISNEIKRKGRYK